MRVVSRTATFKSYEAGVGLYTLPPLLTGDADKRHLPGSAPLMTCVALIENVGPLGGVIEISAFVPPGKPFTATSSTPLSTLYATETVTGNSLEMSTVCVVIDG